MGVLQWPLSLHNITEKETIFCTNWRTEICLLSLSDWTLRDSQDLDRCTLAVSRFLTVKAAFHPPQHRTPTSRPTKESSVMCRRVGMPNIWSKRDGNSASPQWATLALECVNVCTVITPTVGHHQHHHCTGAFRSEKGHFLASVNDCGQLFWLCYSPALLSGRRWDRNTEPHSAGGNICIEMKISVSLLSCSSTAAGTGSRECSLM